MFHTKMTTVNEDDSLTLSWSTLTGGAAVSTH